MAFVLCLTLHGFTASAQLNKLKDKMMLPTGNMGSEQPVKVTISEAVVGKVENPKANNPMAVVGG
jgi:hypothetical protein